jgi:hypothetical protein
LIHAQRSLAELDLMRLLSRARANAAAAAVRVWSADRLLIFTSFAGGASGRHGHNARFSRPLPGRACHNPSRVLSQSADVVMETSASSARRPKRADFGRPEVVVCSAAKPVVLRAAFLQLGVVAGRRGLMFQLYRRRPDVSRKVGGRLPAKRARASEGSRSRAKTSSTN